MLSSVACSGALLEEGLEDDLVAETEVLEDSSPLQSNIDSISPVDVVAVVDAVSDEDAVFVVSASSITAFEFSAFLVLCNPLTDHDKLRSYIVDIKTFHQRPERTVDEDDGARPASSKLWIGRIHQEVLGRAVSPLNMRLGSLESRDDVVLVDMVRSVHSVRVIGARSRRCLGHMWRDIAVIQLGSLLLSQQHPWDDSVLPLSLSM